MTGDGLAQSNVRVTSIACGSSHSLALISTGGGGDILASWGRGEDGQLGHGDAEERLRPQAVFSLMNRGITGVHCGAEYSVAISALNNEVYSWGWGDFGRLGHGDCKDVFIPAPIPALSGIVVASVACGDTHTLVATAAGELYTFGRNQNGQLGFGNINDSLVPQLVESLSDKKVVSVACGAEHSVCSTADGEVFAWGWGRYGNIGDGETQDRHVPTPVKGLLDVNVSTVACGWRHTLAIDVDGVLYSWGWSKYGQLGHGDYSDHLIAKRVDALAEAKVTKVAGGWRHTLAADATGKLYAWGWNKFGQLGIGTNDDVTSPHVVQGLAGQVVTHLASGWKHSMAITETGKFYSWGRGVNGQLGHGDTQDCNVPRLLEELSAGTLSLDTLTKEAHPVVMYSIPAGDRYAVVPDNATEVGAAAVPDAKRQKF